jgi:SAM-dependent methyltransferase
MVGGTAIGVDISARLLDLAVPHPDVVYRQMTEGRIPVDTESIDVVWIVGVLMCITDAEILSRTVTEIGRSLAPGGTVLVAECTSDRPDSAYLAFRPEEAYISMFNGYSMSVVDRYLDSDDRFSVLIGHKPLAVQSPG